MNGTESLVRRRCIIVLRRICQINCTSIVIYIFTSPMSSLRRSQCEPHMTTQLTSPSPEARTRQIPPARISLKPHTILFPHVFPRPRAVHLVILRVISHHSSQNRRLAARMHRDEIRRVVHDSSRHENRSAFRSRAFTTQGVHTHPSRVVTHAHASHPQSCLSPSPRRPRAAEPSSSSPTSRPLRLPTPPSPPCAAPTRAKTPSSARTRSPRPPSPAPSAGAGERRVEMPPQRLSCPDERPRAPRATERSHRPRRRRRARRARTIYLSATYSLTARSIVATTTEVVTRSLGRRGVPRRRMGPTPRGPRECVLCAKNSLTILLYVSRGAKGRHGGGGRGSSASASRARVFARFFARGGVRGLGRR